MCIRDSSITIPFETQGLTRIGRYLLHEGEVVAVMQKPFAIDAEGEYRDCDIEFGTGELTISLDTTGLVYPIEIDPTIEVQVDASADDGWWYTASSFTNNDAYVYAGRITNQINGFNRFTGISGLSGATINTANLTVNFYTISNSPESLIYAEDEESPAAPTNAAECDGASLTDASVEWDPVATGEQVSPSIVSIIQELADSYDPSTIVIFVKDDGSAASNYYRWRSYDNGYGAILKIDYTAGGAAPDITVVPISEALGVLLPSTTYYAFGSAPSNPVEDGECSFTVNNTGAATANITIMCANFTGGVGWTLTSGAPGENTVRITAYYSGQDPASGIVLSNAEQDFCTVNASGSLKWDFKFETGTYTDFIAKSANITLTSYEL